MAEGLKLYKHFIEQLSKLGPIKRAWFTTFNLEIGFFEKYILILKQFRDFFCPLYRGQMDDNFNPKKPKKYLCEICDFVSCNKKDYDKHLLTLKHKKRTNGGQKLAKNRQFICM
jgi:hypothetical protein